MISTYIPCPSVRTSFIYVIIPKHQTQMLIICAKLVLHNGENLVILILMILDCSFKRGTFEVIFPSFNFLLLLWCHKFISNDVDRVHPTPYGDRVLIDNVEEALTPPNVRRCEGRVKIVADKDIFIVCTIVFILYEILNCTCHLKCIISTMKVDGYPKQVGLLRI